MTMDGSGERLVDMIMSVGTDTDDGGIQARDRATSAGVWSGTWHGHTRGRELSPAHHVNLKINVGYAAWRRDRRLTDGLRREQPNGCHCLERAMISSGFVGP